MEERAREVAREVERVKRGRRGRGERWQGKLN